MPYILNKTNGSKLVTVSDASVDITTSLSFVGKNYAGYGEVVNENFLKLLENFSNTTAPKAPLQGQLWFDTTAENKKLHVCHDGIRFKTLANIFIQTSTPSSSTKGDLWWDSDAGQLKAFDGAAYQVVGPIDPYSSRAGWVPAAESSNEEPNELLYVIEGKVGYTSIAVVSKDEFTPYDGTELSNGFDKIKPGISLIGSDGVTGVSATSTASGYLFWGTAAHALNSMKSDTVAITQNNTGTFYLPFVNTSTGVGVTMYASPNISYNATTDVMYATAVSARYADLAERYAADEPYDQGTVLVIGGRKEVTITNKIADIRVAGIVSNSPAYMMNTEAGDDITHPYIALKGRVPCKVVGPIQKGNLLVTSNHSGHAQAFKLGDDPSAVIGKALEDFDGYYGLIEVKV